MKPDGGPAFPSDHAFYPGMTLRDYFAAAALIAVVRPESAAVFMDDKRGPQYAAAEAAYQLADAMLAERAK